MEAALVERQEFLEELKSLKEDLEQQIKAVEDDIDNLLLRIFQSP